MRGKSIDSEKHKEMNILNMKPDQFKMNAEERFIFQKMRELFKQLRELPDEERRDSLITLSLIMNSIFKTNEESKLIPQIEQHFSQLSNRKVSFEGFINNARYDLEQEVVLYDFKINDKKIPFLLSSQLFLSPCFDIYQPQNKMGMDLIILEDELGLQKLYLAGEGILKYKKGEEFAIDTNRQNELSLV
jgi:hypothetical protein